MWVAKTKPHYYIIHFCGHVAKQCACGKSSRNRKITAMLDSLCPKCEDNAKKRATAMLEERLQDAV